MSVHDRYLNEKQKMDDLINKGYIITKVTEDLDGSLVEFRKIGETEKEILRIGNADARKYFSSLIAKQQTELTQ